MKTITITKENTLDIKDANVEKGVLVYVDEKLIGIVIKKKAIYSIYWTIAQESTNNFDSLQELIEHYKQYYFKQID